MYNIAESAYAHFVPGLQVNAKKWIAVGVIGFSGLLFLAGCGDGQLPAPIQTASAPGAGETALHNASKVLTRFPTDMERAATAAATNMAPVIAAGEVSANDLKKYLAENWPIAVARAQKNADGNTAKLKKNVTQVLTQFQDITKTEAGREALAEHVINEAISGYDEAKGATAAELAWRKEMIGIALSQTDEGGYGVGIKATQRWIVCPVANANQGAYKLLHFQETVTGQDDRSCERADRFLRHFQHTLTSPRPTPTPSSFNTGNRWRDLAVMRKMNKRNAEAMRARLSHSYT